MLETENLEIGIKIIIFSERVCTLKMYSQKVRKETVI